MSDIVTEDVFDYLDGLYNSGEMAAHDAAAYIENAYGVSPEEASALHLEWIEGFDQRNG